MKKENILEIFLLIKATLNILVCELLEKDDSTWSESEVKVEQGLARENQQVAEFYKFSIFYDEAIKAKSDILAKYRKKEVREQKNAMKFFFAP